jgi:hypothetical protein
MHLSTSKIHVEIYDDSKPCLRRLIILPRASFTIVFNTSLLDWPPPTRSHSAPKSLPTPRSASCWNAGLDRSISWMPLHPTVGHLSVIVAVTDFPWSVNHGWSVIALEPGLKKNTFHNNLLVTEWISSLLQSASSMRENRDKVAHKFGLAVAPLIKTFVILLRRSRLEELTGNYRKIVQKRRRSHHLESLWFHKLQDLFGLRSEKPE